MKIPAGVASAAHPSGEESDGGAETPTRSRRTRSQIAKANNSKGKERERRTVNYLRVSGFPGAERTVRTGYRNSGRQFSDQGDIDGTPGIAWQIKAVAEKEWYRVPEYMLDTEKQTAAAGADLGILVIPRPRHPHPGDWWAHVWFDDLFTLAATPPARHRTPPGDPSGRHLRVPVRLELQHLLPLLRVAGYGTPLAATPTVTEVDA